MTLFWGKYKFFDQGTTYLKFLFFVQFVFYSKVLYNIVTKKSRAPTDLTFLCYLFKTSLPY